MQDLTLELVKPHEVHLGRLLKPVCVPLDGILSLGHVDRTRQLDVICKLDEGSLYLTLDVIDTVKSSASDPSTDSWGTPLITNLHPDTEPLTTTLWTRSCSQFFIH